MAIPNVGRFVWYELLTTEPKTAIPFYADVVGWKTQPFGNEYVMWVASHGPLGGTMPLPEAARKMGAPPHWMGHVQVADVDASAAKVLKLDGRVHVPPQDIPEIGRFAVIADPQGATLSIFTPKQPMALHDSEKSGEFCWNELLTSDQAAGFRFYRELFGWEKMLDHDMGPTGTYLIYGIDGKQLGGMFTMPKGQMPPAWLYYIQVESLDASLDRAKKAGAKVMNGPMEVPGGARIVQLMDPQGAVVALHERARA